jgi:hypothetical protein
MRYKESVEDYVHQLLSERLAGICTLFGQLPDVLEDVWIDVALGQLEQRRRLLMPSHNSIPLKSNTIR